MSAATLITALYPPAVRERWGPEISQEVYRSGARSWPDAVAGAARLWLHPSDWPEVSTGQTRRVLAVTVFTITAVATLVLRATTPSATFTADVHHPATSLWLLPVLLGIGLATPVPLLRWDALRHLAAVAARTLTAPAVAALAMLLIARSGLTGHPARHAQAALVVCYWATLGFVALRLCTLVARVRRGTAPPTTGRLRASLLLIGTGLALATGQDLLGIARATPHVSSFAMPLALGLLAATAISTGRDLRGSRT